MQDKVQQIFRRQVLICNRTHKIDDQMEQQVVCIRFFFSKQSFSNKSSSLISYPPLKKGPSHNSNSHGNNSNVGIYGSHNQVENENTDLSNELSQLINAPTLQFIPFTFNGKFYSSLIN